MEVMSFYGFGGSAEHRIEADVGLTKGNRLSRGGGLLGRAESVVAVGFLHEEKSLLPLASL